MKECGRGEGSANKDGGRGEVSVTAVHMKGKHELRSAVSHLHIFI